MIGFNWKADLSGLQAVRTRLRDPKPYFLDGGQRSLRLGPSGISQQMDAGSEIDFGSRTTWPETKPFGTQKAPRRTLQRKGHLREAWLGIGAGAITVATSGALTIGVDTEVLRYAGVFQAEGPTVITVTEKQRVYLGMEFGVWLKPGHQIVLEPRRVSLNDAVLQDFADGLVDYLLTGRTRGGREAA